MKTQNQIYKSPEVVIVDITSECVLCTSGVDDNFTIQDYEKETGSWD